MATRRFSAGRLNTIDAIKYLYIRCGEHRPIAIWVVIVAGRVIVRSWNDKPSGWYRAFRRQPLGVIMVGDSEISIRAIPVRSDRLNDAADLAYAAKYTSKANLSYVKGFGESRRKANTLELTPV